MLRTISEEPKEEEAIMGGVGSGRKGDEKNRKRLVEDCIRLDLGKLIRQGLMEHGRVLPRIMGHFNGLDGPAPKYYEVRLETPAAPGLQRSNYPKILQVLRLRPEGGKSLVLEDTQFVDLETTPVRNRGERLWMLCPGRLPPITSTCGKRTSILYLPPEEKVFLCRECHDLKYRSNQTWNSHTCSTPSPDVFPPFVMGGGGDPSPEGEVEYAFDELVQKSLNPSKSWEDSPEGLASVAVLTHELKRLGLNEGDELFAQTLALTQDLLRGTYKAR